MGREIDGGKILARLILDTSQIAQGVASGVKKFDGMVKRFAEGTKRIGSSLKGIGESIKREASDIGDIADRMIFVGAALTAPFALALNKFANQGDLVKKKLAEINEKRKALFEKRAGGGLTFIDQARLNLELNMLGAQQQALTRNNEAYLKAAQTKERLLKVLDQLALKFGELVFQVIEPYIPKVFQLIEQTKQWIEQNRPLVMQIIKMVGGLGLFMLTAGPVLEVVIKLVEIFGLLVMAVGGTIYIFGALVGILSAIALPVAALVAVGATLLFFFGEQLDPVAQQLVDTLRTLWTAFVNGQLTVSEALKQLGNALVIFVADSLVVMGEKITEWVNVAWAYFQEQIQKGLNAISGYFSEAGEWWSEFFSGIYDTGKSYIDKVIGVFNSLYAGIKKPLDFIHGLFDGAVFNSWFVDGMAAFAGSAEMGMGAVAGSFNRAAKSMRGSLSGMQGAMGGASVSQTNNIAPAFTFEEMNRRMRGSITQIFNEEMTRFTKRI